MGFFIFLLCNCLLIPVILWGSVKLFNRYPASRNSIYGYRTSSSLQSDEAWVYAQQQWMQVWRTLAKWMLITAVPLLFCTGASRDTTGMVATAIVVVQLVLMLGSIPIIERKVRRKFPH